MPSSSGTAQRADSRRRVFRAVTALALGAAALGGIGAEFAGSEAPREEPRAGSFGSLTAWQQDVPGPSASLRQTRQLLAKNAEAYAPLEIRRIAVVAATTHETATIGLIGFKAGRSLCLIVSARDFYSAPDCMSPATLWRLPTHAMPVALGERLPINGRAVYLTYGLADDSVQEVKVELEDGSQIRLPVRANVFLAATSREPVALSSVTPQGESLVPLHGGDLADSAPLAALVDPRPEDLPGPSEVSAPGAGTSIGLIDGEQAEGSPFRVDDQAVRSFGHVQRSRVLRPNGDIALALAVVRAGGTSRSASQVCSIILEPFARGNLSSTCSTRSSLFALQPFTLNEAHGGEGSFVRTVAGLSADEVAHLNVYRLDGRQFEIDVRQNAFVEQFAEAELPVKIVAIDSAGAVLGMRILL